MCLSLSSVPHCCSIFKWYLYALHIHWLMPDKSQRAVDYITRHLDFYFMQTTAGWSFILFSDEGAADLLKYTKIVLWKSVK